jgi:hypothetical protein
MFAMPLYFFNISHSSESFKHSTKVLTTGSTEVCFKILCSFPNSNIIKIWHDDWFEDCVG